MNGSTPKVQYQCTAAVDGVLRRTGVVYPDGRALNYEYGTSGSIDDALNRVQSIHNDDLTVLAEFEYLGNGMPTITTLPEPAVQRRWKKWSSESNGDAGDPYTGYDRFGRWVHLRWFKEDTTPIPLVNVKWGYNRASLKTWRQDVLATSLSAAQDQHFTYDGLYQVNGRQLGVLNGSFTGITGTPVQAEDFTYDETGNWVTYEQNNGGILEIDQSREHNTSNQITEIDEVSSGVDYDANGNMLKIPTGGAALDGSPHKLVWDAWNRLRKVSDAADNVLAEYEYDAKTRRTVSHTATTRHTYFNDQWRSVEERIGSSASAECQQVWHPADRWELLLRDRSTANNGTLDERLYSLKDQLDPVAICDASGEIQERYAYSAFGITTVLDEDFVERTVNESDFAWNWLFHGEFRDEVTDWYNYGYRYYVPDLGRWLSKDPIEERGGLNLYSFALNNPTLFLDAMGREPVPHDGLGPFASFQNPKTNCGALAAFPNAVKDGAQGGFTPSPENMTNPSDRFNKDGSPGAGCRKVQNSSDCRKQKPDCERHVVILVPKGEDFNSPQKPNFHAIGQINCDPGYYHQTGGGGTIHGPVKDPIDAAKAYYDALAKKYGGTAYPIEELLRPPQELDR